MKSVYKFCKSFPENNLTYDNIETVVRYCHIYTINPFPVLLKMEMETGLLRGNTNRSQPWLMNRAMGFGLFKKFRKNGLKYYIYGGYDIQVFHAIKRLRDFFDEWKPGTPKYIVDLKTNIILLNASTYSLYRYTPFYGTHNEYNWEYEVIGNKGFKILFSKYKLKWKTFMGGIK
jgi:hypothetical protein